MKQRSLEHWFIQIPGWLLTAYLAIAQALPAIDYDIGVRMGTQVPATDFTDVGVAFAYGFDVADLVFYVPVLAIGLVGHWGGRAWSRIVLAAPLGISVYWPIVALVAFVNARGAPGWTFDEKPFYLFWIIWPCIALWALWALWRLARSAGIEPAANPRVEQTVSR